MEEARRGRKPGSWVWGHRQREVTLTAREGLENPEESVENKKKKF